MKKATLVKGKVESLNVELLGIIMVNTLLTTAHMGLSRPTSLVRYFKHSHDNIESEFFTDYLELCSIRSKDHPLNLQTFMKKWFGTDNLAENKYYHAMMKQIWKRFE